MAEWGLSNSSKCLAALRDKRIVGYLESALPINRPDLSKGNVTLVFEDGTGFTFSDHGSFWHESAEDVARAIDRLGAKLKDASETYQRVLDMAGAKP